MHELALIRDIIARLEAIAAENSARRISRIRLRVGALSHISPDAFREQFKMMAGGRSVLDGTTIEIYVADEMDEHAQDVLLESVDIEC
ncbi:MAG: hydrogenase maturation nickel metallochaperone HypA [Candidatus Nitrosocaldus sp.]|nr:hydrogenase maturation nickel metallochaperone HypA [Candidatus Nitrosocaldus sp.]MCS7141738.1 hydrogenase maturation nickel metallochaperone HypA [Candidatus Nitrosocaldus sp.]MDW8000818.1 hydrogenase maturation nickel metallochaperone HypA [Candidatus Nitrosocaldus sp.]MDW8276264.1 hydrogenase maturation nickel metallochaperone HypA [Candidatus Nitrosocaldus sp.]